MNRNMGTVIHTVEINAPAAMAWNAISDVGQLHIRVAPGMVVDTRLESDGATRVVTFANDVVLTEQIISNDPEAMRLAWTAAGGPWVHHNASLTVVRQQGGCAVTWTADVLPHEEAEIVGGFVEAGLATFKAHLEAQRR